MPDLSNRTTETELSSAVLQILFNSSAREMSIHDLIQEIPNHITLTPQDMQRSVTRPNEEVWEQRVRNIQSHHEAPGNYIAEGLLEHVNGGLRITAAGRLHCQP